MNRKIQHRLLFLVSIILISGTFTWAQVVVERSKDKVIISGVTYYLHTVKKGETIYSISRAYGVSPEELISENPVLVDGLREGQGIRINASKAVAAQDSGQAIIPQRKKDENKFIYHKLQPGETIYQLSRKYSVSEHEIIQSNPDIDITKLPLGFEIAIPRKELMNQKQSFESDYPQKYLHKVTRGETLSSIARKYGVTVRDLRRENRDIRFPQVGDYLKIPGMQPEQITIPEEIAEDTVVTVQDDQMVYLEKPSEYTPVSALHGSYDVAVLLPLYLNENTRRTEIDSSKSNRGSKVYRVINRPDDWIYPRSLGFVEMYEGILLAADTLCSLGLNVNIHVHDITDDTIAVKRLIKSGELDQMDLIIGPVYSDNLLIVASYARNLGIPVVSPVQLNNNSVLQNNPSLFMASGSLKVAQKALAEKMKDYSDRNIVLIHSESGIDSIAMYTEFDRFRNMILSEMNSVLPFDEIKLRDMVFYSRSVFGNDSINRLSHALSDRNGNVVVIASEDPPVMSESITDVHALARKFNMVVYGYPNIRYLDNFDHRIWFELGLMIYTPYWIDYSREDVLQFNSDFRKKFLTEPSEMSYAWQGYDILYYFLSGLAIYGKDFLIHPEIHNPDLLHTEFDFRRSNINDGFENQMVFLIRYSDNYQVELLDETTSEAD